MKSQRYPILPRVRLIVNTERHKMYKAVWRDPGDLAQRKGEPLRFTDEYVAYGFTVDDALRNLQLKYKDACNIRDRFNMAIRVSEAPDHCLATSNLPWWKRLFRI